MPHAFAVARARIQAQGFCGLNDEAYAQINYPLRLAPAICMVWAATGTLRGSPAILAALVPFALAGAILPAHPFDVLYNRGLRYVLRTPPLPRYPPRRRFACALATLFLIVAASAFHAGMPVAGAIAGGAVTAAAFVNVSTGFCIPSFLCSLAVAKPRR